jgi:hypothetical protein
MFIHLFHFSICFEKPRAHHQENQLYQYNIWYVSLWPSRIILVNDQLDAQFLFLYVYFNSLHLSSNFVLIIRRINCVNTTPAVCHSDSLECRSGRNSFPTWILEGQSDTYQMLYWHNRFSWWWARGCSIYVENWNKHTEKTIARQVGYLQKLLLIKSRTVDMKIRNNYCCI